MGNVVECAGAPGDTDAHRLLIFNTLLFKAYFWGGLHGKARLPK